MPPRKSLFPTERLNLFGGQKPSIWEDAADKSQLRTVFTDVKMPPVSDIPDDERLAVATQRIREKFAEQRAMQQEIFDLEAKAAERKFGF